MEESMGCQEFHSLMDARVDGELEVITSFQFEKHLSECPKCRSLYAEYAEFNRTVRAGMPRFDAPTGLEQKIRSQLGLRKRVLPASAGVLAGWRTWAVAATVAAFVLLGSLLLTTMRPKPGNQLLADEVVSSHIRSLMANHLSDVASTDQHTVKPWFSGKLDFAPVVKDLAPVGFSLTGGRLDYLDDHTVAALIYKRRKHTINLFLWPANAPDMVPQVQTLRGFNLVHWTQGRMNYWAISDLNATELEEFANDLRNNPS
jgi:anti-sigma factor RsiW